jgi:hypothetical protein
MVDKTNGYDVIYHQPVIKPALVGLAGPWISGGIEFNWPQHHRPSTFMPAEVSIEEETDGAVTVWLGEHEPMNRMRACTESASRPAAPCLSSALASTTAPPTPKPSSGGPTSPHASTNATSPSSRRTPPTSPTTPSAP